MAMFSVKIDLAGINGIGETLGEAVFTRLSGAVARTVAAGEERWKTAVLSAPLWEGERRAYADSIHGQMLTPLSGEIVSNYRYVEDIETGRPAYDMKVMLDTSLKVRLNKKGQRYLIIPMRHNTPGNTALAPAMPTAVYAEAKQLAASKIVGHGSRLSGTGAWDVKTKQPARVRTRQYLWGGRLGAGLGPKLAPHHKTDPYAGMVRFKESTGGSTYLTFRTMSENSSGWIRAAKPGLGIAKAVTESLERMVNFEFPAAVAEDIRAA